MVISLACVSSRRRRYARILRVCRHGTERTSRDRCDQRDLMDQLARSVLFIIRLTDQKNGGGAARLVGVDGFAFLHSTISQRSSMALLEQVVYQDARVGRSTEKMISKYRQLAAFWPTSSYGRRPMHVAI